MRPILAAFAGALTTLAFTPYQYWPLAIFSPLILFLLLHKIPVKTAFLCGFAWGIGQFATGISWVHVSIDNFGGLPKTASLALMALLISYLALYPALFAALLNRFFPSGKVRYLFAIPSLWLASELARGWVFTGLPWLWLGYSQIDSPLASFAPVGGVTLITFVTILTASALAIFIQSRCWQWIALPVAVFMLATGLSTVEWVVPDPDSSTSFALIQGNIAQEKKWLPEERWPSIMKYTDLSRANWDADIIIWPEAAIPAIERDITSFLGNLDSAARMNHSALLTGIINFIDGHYLNSILPLGEVPDGEYNYLSQSRYNKYHLLPFGEFVPFEEILRPIAPLFNLPMSSFSRGDMIQKNVVAKGRHLAPALCYEIIFGDQVRQNITQDTDFILTLSNDAWFGHSIGPLQHMEIARMRALENGKPLIRSTNNGVTAITDYHGKIIAQAPQFETQVLRATISSTTGLTPYTRFGNWPLIGLIAMGLGIMGLQKKAGD